MENIVKPPDYAEPLDPLQKLRDSGIDPDLYKKHGLERVPLIELNKKQQQEMVDSYTHLWRHALIAEYREGKIKPLGSSAGLSEDGIIQSCVWDQLLTSGKRSPESQIVLTKKINGKERPVMLTRSQLWHVPDMSDEDRYFKEFYFNTWYLASNNGMGYEWIPELVNGKPRKFKDYQDVLGREKPDLNRLDVIIISNYALTKNIAEDCDIKIAPKAAVYERAKYAVERGIKHCDTFSPLNNFAKWVEEKREEDPLREYTPKDFIDENVIKFLDVKEKVKNGELDISALKKFHYTAIGMHMGYDAKSMRYFENARIDPDSLNYCGMCRYF